MRHSSGSSSESRNKVYNFGGGRELPKAQGVGGKKRNQSEVRSDAGEGGKKRG